MSVIESTLDTRAERFVQNRTEMLQTLGELDALHEEVAAGGGEEAMQRLRARGKMPLRERIAMVLDPDTPFLEISPLAAWRSQFTVGSGFVVGIGVIEGVECVILGHDPSVRAGAFNAFNAKKLMRGLEIARDNRMPYVQFVESAGADLRGESDGDPEAAIRRETGHFAESGRLFYEITELSKMRIPTISVVFGASTAGGAYQPGMSDYNIFIRGQSKVFLGGPPLVKMATGEDADEESLGGAQMHCTISGLGDYLAEDETDGIRMCREVVSHLNWRKQGPGPTRAADEPLHHDVGLAVILAHLVDRHHMRVVDGGGGAALAQETLPRQRIPQFRGMQHLDRDLALQLLVAGKVDTAHATLPDRVHDRVAADRRGDAFAPSLNDDVGAGLGRGGCAEWPSLLGDVR
jgi:acetyl-CoA carboxylase carboxyltransferase component